MTVSSSETLIHEQIANELQTLISGGIALPHDESYEAARRVWNPDVPHRPAIIAFCQNTADVQSAVRTARRHTVPFSVRGGGHDWAGRALCHNGLTIDLTRMRKVVVDLQSRVATMGGGARVKDVAALADAHGLVAALGNCGAVGVTGLTLGGGYGPLIGEHGLALDNLRGAEVVLADGRCVMADSHNEPDLFWALRGGGGNFGVVTSLRLRLHKRSGVIAGSILYPWSEAHQVLSRYAGFATTAPDELGLHVGMLSTRDGQSVIRLAPMWTGEKLRGESIIRDLLAFGTPLQAEVGEMDYSDVLAPIDAMVEQAAGQHWAIRTRLLPVLTPGAIDVMRAAFERRTSPHCVLSMYHFHGAGTRIATDATAFGQRREHFMLEIAASWSPDGDDGSTHRAWAQNLKEDFAPFALPGGYANFLGPEDREQAAYAYGGNGGRLRDLKRRFDPDGVFASAIPLPD